MIKPAFPDNERERQQALEATGLLDKGAEARFDRITRLAQKMFSVPIALVSLVDRDRQWFKSSMGLEASETPREVSFCGHAILHDAVLVVEDALTDARFIDNPLVCGSPDIRFYAGAPLHTASGHRIGTLCLIDTEPRESSDDQVEMLRLLAATVDELIQADELSRRAQQALESELVTSQNDLASLVNNMPGAAFRCLPDAHWTMLYLSGQIERICGYSAEALIGNARLSYASLIHPDDAARVAATIAQAVEAGMGWQLAYRLRHRLGGWRWVEERGQLLGDKANRPSSMEGFIVDITREHEAQTQLNKHQGALLLLNDIAFNRQQQLDQRIQYALAKARAYLGMDLAMVSQVESDQYLVQWHEGTLGSRVSFGQPLAIQQTWCQLLLAGERTELFIADTQVSEFRLHACSQALPLAAYAGAVIEVEGQIYGTLSLAASQPRSAAFDDSETLFVRLLARWLANTLESSLRQERLQKLMAQLPGVVYQFRRFPDGRAQFPFSSPQIKDLLGVTPEQAAVDASAAFTVIHRDDQDMVTATINHSASTLEPWHAVYRVRQADNSYRWLAGQARPEALKDGSVLWHGFLQDINEQEHARQALKRNESRLRSLFEFAPIGIALNDFATGQFIDLNDALLQPSGYNRDEFVDLSYWDLTPKEYQSLEEQALVGLKEQGRYGPFEKEYQRKDGSRYPVRLQGMLSEDPNGRTVIWSLIEDISERRRLDKMKDQFIATVSHELRTPLTSIKGALGLLAAGAVGALPDQAQGLVNNAKRNAERLHALINDLLDMEKLVAGKMPMNRTCQPLAPLVTETLESMQAYAQQHEVHLQAMGQADRVEVLVDGPRLMQALTNLISNAIKFSPSQAVVTIWVETEGDVVRIRVCDQGPGVEPGFRSQLFQRFSQADGSDRRKLPGTGLGLAITREISQQLGGEVDYQDGAEGGSEFVITLPVA